MDLDKWISENMEHLLLTTRNIVKNDTEAEDVFQSVMEQLLKKRERMNTLKDKEKLYFFIRVVKNNYFSKTSKYYTEHKKTTEKNVPINDGDFNTPDSEYVEDIPDIEWVKNELDKLSWFERDLFLMWLELGSLINVSKATTIPVNSVGTYIKQIKNKLKEKWENKN